jgi:hypothetical protein
VVVARPNVVVGGGAPTRSPGQQQRPASEVRPKQSPTLTTLFGESQERSLDEVILDYLTDDKPGST